MTRAQWENLKEGDIIQAIDGDILSVMMHDFYEDGETMMCLTDGISIWRGCDFFPEDWELIKSKKAIDFVYSDGGRSQYYKGERGDCLCRAICNATGLDYKVVYDKINEYSKKERTCKRRVGKSSARNGVHKVTAQKIIQEWLGWEWHPTMQIGSGCRVHVREEELPSGNIILNLSRHYSCVRDGVLYDTFDCSEDGQRCVYGYWKERR